MTLICIVIVVIMAGGEGREEYVYSCLDKRYDCFLL